VKHAQAIRLAIQSMQRETSALAVNANLHDRMGLDVPSCVNDSQKRKLLNEAIALLQPAPAPETYGAYSLIYLDPPWKYNSRANHKTRFRGGAQGHYPLMTMAEIAALPIPALAAKDAALLMWCTFPYLEEQIRLFDHWGFSFRTQFLNWTKLNPVGYDLPKDDPNYADGKPYVLYRDGLFHSVFFGVGYYAKSNPEVCLLGMRGQLPTVSDAVSSVILAPRREHSRKPDEAYERIEQVFGDVKRIELFARQSAPGWDVAGNGIDGRDINETLAEMAA
jgi:N6-adenosine-specific RNA methylase IME4